jgi:hypothetical protein
MHTAPDSNDRISHEKKVHPMPRALPEELRPSSEENFIHPDWRNHVHNNNLNISDLDLSATIQGPHSHGIESTK